uniref:Uncharacterized protein n=1 Tax=Cyprinodon variegatus TaxID=28743 RepID=A0A3Q2CAU2_CYPVA
VKLRKQHGLTINFTCCSANVIDNRFQRKSSQFLCFPTSQLIAELQTSVCDSKEEAVRLQQAMEKQLKEVNARWDEERQTITQNALLEKVENLQRQLHCAEKKLLSKELESEERVTKVHQEYEEKIKGLMPADLRQELEDTITYLKAQVRNYLVKINKILHNSAESYGRWLKLMGRWMETNTGAFWKKRVCKRPETETEIYLSTKQ